MSDFTHEVFFSPAYDKRDPNPSKNYGIGSVVITFICRRGMDDEQATQFKMSAGWYPPTVDTSVSGRMAWDLGYHSPTPRYEGHASIGHCEYTGGDCFYDGSTLNAEPVMARLIAEGDVAVWDELERYYVDLFETESAS
jgi:hypothetical protein